MTFAPVIDACLAGLWSVFAWPQFGFLAIGVSVGAVVGILPGLGGSATLAMLLPFTLTLPPTEAFALLIGVAAVTATTGDLTSILVGIPGEPISAATVLDGRPMAVRGEAARAIGASLVSSLAGSIFGALTLGLMIPLALPLARSIGSPELFMLAVLGITFMAPLSGGSRFKGLAIGSLGLLLATIGMDPITATPRFTFGQLMLWDGVGLISAALGLFAIPEIVELAGRPSSSQPAALGTGRLSAGMRDAARHWVLVLQSSAIGTAIGLLPGVGASVSQWIAYGHASRRSTEPTAFGRGAIEGVIAPSAANNATLGGSLVPALALGIPGGLLSALLMTALVMKGLVPGPSMIAPDAEGGHLTLVFTFVWLLVVANALAVALACVTTGWLVKIAALPAWRIVPLLLVLTFVGAFAERNATGDLVLTLLFGMLGLALVHFGWPRAPLLMGLVLGPLAENRLFLSMQAYGWAWLTRPGVLLIALVVVASLVRPSGSKRATSRRDDMDARPVPARRAEWIFGLTLVTLPALALMAARSYPSAARFVPALASVTMIACLLAAYALDPAWRQSLTETSIAPGRSLWSADAPGWLLIFFLLIWGLGFLVGAPVAVLGHLLFSSRRPPGEALLLAGATAVVLYVVLMRGLNMTLPPGALIAWLSERGVQVL